MNIYMHELKANIKNTVLWICVLCGLAVIIMLFYPTIKSDIDNFMKILNNFPPAMKAIFGMVSENFSSAIGYYNFVFTYTTLFGAIQAMNLGIGILSKEERERTADFLMTKPISRVKILTAKILSVLTIFCITDLIYFAITYSLVNGMSEQSFEADKFVLINASLFLLQLIFFSIGLIISVAAKKIKSVLPISLGLVFMFFAISAFAVTSEDDKLRFLTPFQYFKTNYILTEGNYESLYLIAGLLIIIVCVIFSYILYKHKNIHAV
ncbi:MAG: transporter, permease protein [Clostridia bacterium]|nr:transporter, permease protein [Clostridia bacterium]